MTAYELIERLQSHSGYQVIVRGYELITTIARNAEVVGVTLDEEHKTLIINVVEQDEEGTDEDGFGTVVNYAKPKTDKKGRVLRNIQTERNIPRRAINRRKMTRPPPDPEP